MLSLVNLNVMLAMTAIGAFGQPLQRPQPRASDGLKIWDSKPMCGDIQAAGSTWLAAAMCAVAKCNPDAIKKIIRLGATMDTDNTGERVVDVGVTLSAHDLVQKEYPVTYESAAKDLKNSAGDHWWPAAITSAVIEQGGRWLNDDGAPIGVDNPTYMFQSDNTEDWDAAVGLWMLTRIGAQVEAADDKGKLWDWFVAARNSPTVVKTKGVPGKDYDDHWLDHPRAYTVKETEVDDDGKWVKLWNPVKTEDEWYKLDDIFDEIDNVGHLIDFAGV